VTGACRKRGGAGAGGRRSATDRRGRSMPLSAGANGIGSARSWQRKRSDCRISTESSTPNARAPGIMGFDRSSNTYAPTSSASLASVMAAFYATRATGRSIDQPGLGRASMMARPDSMRRENNSMISLLLHLLRLVPSLCGRPAPPRPAISPSPAARRSHANGAPAQAPETRSAPPSWGGQRHPTSTSSVVDRFSSQAFDPCLTVKGGAASPLSTVFGFRTWRDTGQVRHAHQYPGNGGFALDRGRRGASARCCESSVE